jgi:alpha-galactosidase
LGQYAVPWHVYQGRHADGYIWPAIKSLDPLFLHYWQKHGILLPRADALPAAWVGPVPAAGIDPDDVAALLAAARPCPLLPQHGEGWFGRPGLAGHRLGVGPGGPVAGRDWSPVFRPVRSEHDGTRARVEAEDTAACLRLVTEVEAVPGGAIRARHRLTNTGSQPYVVDSLEVVFPLPARVGEVLDFTGRPMAERIPQRHRIGDGLWLREGRRGHTGHDSATVLIAGVPGLTFSSGEAYGLHAAWSGNTVHRVERVPSRLGLADGGGRMQSGVTTIGGGELLLPGEVTLAEGESYATPWVYLTATRSGLDGLSAQFHGYLRALPAHPGSARPVNLNVWEAVYFRHDFSTLAALADIAADIGVERYVLDDGWFTGRRSDQAGLGDWQVDEHVWPGGLHRLAEHVRARGMQFGLWIEPEMVNPDSDLFRAHPDWILAAGQRRPPLQRHQLVLDLTRPEVTGYLLERISALLSEYEISYVKWDCNRDIIDAGSGARAGRPRPGAGGLRAAGRAATAASGRRVGILCRRRRPDRPGYARARPASMDLGYDRCAGPAVHPALDRAAGAARVSRRARVGPVLASDRPVHADVAALRHRLVRPFRAARPTTICKTPPSATSR